MIKYVKKWWKNHWDEVIVAIGLIMALWIMTNGMGLL